MRSVYFIPVYNQINEFPILLSELKSASLPCDTILLVNNGSSDGSEGLVRASGYPYLDFKQNLGVGYSYIKAVEWALENGYDLFGTMSSNGKMLPSEIGRVMDPVLSGAADYVTGSRFLHGGRSPNLPRFRRNGIPIVNQWVRLTCGARLTDSTCGFRAWRLDLIRRANFDWRAKWLYTYGFEYYLYAKIILNRTIRYREVPITMRYPVAGKKYTKIRPVIGWYEMLKPWAVAAIDGYGFN